MKKVMVFVLVGMMVLGSLSCSSWSRKEKGAVAGAGAGAVVGGLIGKATGNTAVGAILGAAIGGVAGAYIGDYMDDQAAEIEKDIKGAKVERVGEGIKITFDSGILFDVDKASLKPPIEAELVELALILNKYNDTNILLEGHTDSTGSEEHNLDLSRKRAQSVSNFLAVQEVSPTRFTIMGYGEVQPIAENATAEGRSLNRRVEIAIYANDKLKKVAEEQAKKG
ncbi:OmpA family protein [Candidatus Eisenbacteria bacterium]|uniref:OmpA family protein n=1 Tax=Eiseniibacteriota bacterium TaxID=2212470 RepID=A0ABV6YMW5_UNCEI